MARGQRQVPNLYFGRPGKLVTLPWPRGGIDRSPDRQTYDFMTGSGLHQLSRLAVASRAYTLNWEALHQDTYTLLEQHNLGANGPGPWALIDPSAPNILPLNVAAATGLTLDATDLVTKTVSDANGIVGSNSDANFIHRTTGNRSIRWLFPGPTVATEPVLLVQPQFRNWAAIPCLPGLSYAFSSWVRVDGTVETSATLAHKIDWLDATGTRILLSTGGDVAVTATWARRSCIAVAPAGAVYAMPRWVLDGPSMAAGGALYIDEPLFEQDTVVNDWAPGTGIRPVEITGMPETVPFEARFRTNVSMGLRELTK